MVENSSHHTSRPLPLRGARNVRDLGGFPFVTEDGARGVTACGVLLRGCALTRLRRSDFRLLESYGLSRVVDLRSGLEVRIWPDPYARSSHPGISYVRVPMMDHLNSNGFQGLLPASMFDSYRDLLDSDAEAFRALFEAIDVPGCSLFHCRVGKDRTGVVAMLLLDAAGVSREDIIADYAATERYMGGFLRLQRVGVSILTRHIVPRCLFEAAPVEMERTLDYLHGRYGGAFRYLVDAAGCPPEQVRRVLGRLRGRAAGTFSPSV